MKKVLVFGGSGGLGSTLIEKYNNEKYEFISLSSEDCYIPLQDEEYRYKDHETLANDIITRYNEVINDNDYLKEIANNAREWYVRNIMGSNFTKNLIKQLEL